MDDQEYTFIKREVKTLTGIDLNFYKDTQMQRRLGTYLLRSGQPTWKDYFQKVRSNSVELRKFKDYLTINVSSFFRDMAKYDYLRGTILPQLLKERKKLRVWSAGCSRGQEPYTLAMVLAELSGPYQRHYILASDLDRSALDAAEAGGPYTADDLANVTPEQRKKYFEMKDSKFWVKDDLKNGSPSGSITCWPISLNLTLI
jgi:chemotaxis protein methyltransferase CheR